MTDNIVDFIKTKNLYSKKSRVGTKKELFIKNIEYIKKGLANRESINQLCKKYSSEYGSISYKLFMTYCKVYLPSDYSRSIKSRKDDAKSKKKVFIGNLEYIKNMLRGNSVRAVHKAYCDKHEKLSWFAFITYCKELLGEELNIFLMEGVLRKNADMIGIYLAPYKSGEVKCSQIYRYMLESDFLNTSTSPNCVIVGYDHFKKWLESLLDGEYSNFVIFDELKGSDVIIQEYRKKKFYLAKDKRVVVNLSKQNIDIKDTEDEIGKSASSKAMIKIKLTDDSWGDYSDMFLRNYYVEREYSKIKYDIIEFNSYYISNMFQNKLYDFPMIKERLESEQLLENYSLIIYDDGVNSGNHYIYRYIDRELILLGEPKGIPIAATNEVFVADARKRFFDFVNEFIPEAVRRKL